MELHDAVDPECEALAEHFLGDDPDFMTDMGKYDARVHDLAVAIQRAVEEWLATHTPVEGQS